MPPVPSEGARILEVKPDTPAALAGLRAGDRIVTLDDELIRSRNDLIDKLNCIAARTTIVLGVVRAGEPAGSRIELRVRTASHPGRPAEATESAPRTPAEPRSGRTSPPEPPVAARVEPAAPGSTSTGPNPPAPAAVPTAPPRPTTAHAPAPSPADHTGPAPPATGAPGSINELELALPRAFVERIEHLERRINELEHVRGTAGATARAAGIDERARRPQSTAQDGHPAADRTVRPARPSTP